MSNYIKFYKKKGSKSIEPTHRALFIDARGHFPKHLLPSRDYYYVLFGKYSNDWDMVGIEMKMEDFNKFIKDYKQAS